MIKICHSLPLKMINNDIKKARKSDIPIYELCNDLYNLNSKKQLFLCVFLEVQTKEKKRDE